jgi:hypothetical protein
VAGQARIENSDSARAVAERAEEIESRLGYKGGGQIQTLTDAAELFEGAGTITMARAVKP